MSNELFRLGIAFIMLALLFPLVEIIDKLVGSGTAAVTLILWLIGVSFIFASALSKSEKQNTGKNP